MARLNHDRTIGRYRPVLITSLALLALLASRPGSAAVLTFEDLTDVVHTFTDFPNASIQPGPNSGPDEKVVVTLVPTAGQTLAPMANPISVGLTEPPTDFNAPGSDLLTLSVVEPTSAFPVRNAVFTFISDTTGPVPFPSGTTTLAETGGVQNLTSLFAPVTTALGLTVTVQSDFGPGAEVPEPATVTLLGSGGVFLAGWLWWRRQGTRGICSSRA